MWLGWSGVRVAGFSLQAEAGNTDTNSGGGGGGSGGDDDDDDDDNNNNNNNNEEEEEDSGELKSAYEGVS